MKAQKLFCTTLLSAAVAWGAFSQELPYAWLNSVQPVRVVEGGPSSYMLMDSRMDGEGNIYVTGYFNCLCDFDPSEAENNLFNYGERDIFLAKYSVNGELIYVTQMASHGKSSGHDLEITSGGKIILTGKFEQFMTFDPQGVSFQLYADGQGDIFIAQFDGASGAFEQAVRLGGFDDDVVNDISVSSDGSMYLAGTFQQWADFDPGPENTATYSSSRQYFLLKLTDLNTFAWVKIARDFKIHSLHTDNNGVYGVGTFSGSIDLDPGTGSFPATSNGSTDAWFGKFNTDGSLAWAKTFGGAKDDGANDILADATGNLYVGGYFKDQIDLDPGTGSLNVTANGLNADAFVSKFDPLGDLQWAKNWGGPLDERVTNVRTVDSGMRLVISGEFHSTSLDLDPGAATVNVTNQGINDVFVSLFSDQGNFINGFSYGSHGEETGFARTNGVYHFVLLGSFTNTVDFDPTSNVGGLSTPEGFTQGYVSSYSLLSTVPAAQPTNLVLSPASGTVTVSFTPATADGYVIIRQFGQVPATPPADGKTYTAGNYLGDGVVVYSGGDNSVTDVSLSGAATYGYAVYAYNQTGGEINYLATAPLTGTTSTSGIAPWRGTDSLALVNIYNSTNGAGWSNSSGWLAGPLESWYGITIGGPDRVTGINLSGNNLQGTLPTTIGNLDALTTFEVSANYLTGHIPGEIGNIVTLSNVNLYGNQFTGSIPPSFGNLSNLIFLELGNNKLSGSIPAEIGGLTNLQILWLGTNELSGTIPVEIGQLTSLIDLNLSGNKLEGSIPIELGSLSALNYIHLQDNQLTGNLPSELGNLTSLLVLAVDNNQLSGAIPAFLGSMTSLAQLYLQGNQFSGAIPTELGNLVNLQQLYLSSNQLSGAVPNSITNLTSLQTLGLEGNSITDLPDMSGMTSLFNLYVADNSLSFGDIEPNINKLSYGYSPQKTFGTSSSVNVNAGDLLNLSFTTDGSANIYQWQVNGQDAAGDTLSSVSRPATASDYGTWTLKVTNTIAPDLELYSEPITVVVRAEGMFSWAEAGDLTNDGLNAGIYGGAWGDYDNDGFEDIFTIGTNDSIRGHLYHNDGTGTFTRVPGAFDFADGRSGAWGDYNNDGATDLFIPDASFAPDSTDGIAAVYRNNQDGSFTKISLNKTAISGSWTDIDFDGDLDLSLEGTESARTVIMRNDGNDVFTEVNYNLNDGTQWNAIWIDYDNNARPDYFLPSVYSNENRAKLFEHEDGNNFYETYYFNQTFTAPSLGGSWADIDNDGDYDLFLTLHGQESMFYINEGTNNSFMEVPSSAKAGEPIITNRASAFGDLNNDGYVDLITTRVHSGRSIITAYLNNGDGTFSKLMNQTFKPSDARIGISLADYDNDGALDIFTGGFSATSNGLYRNLSTGNHWIKIKLQGLASNRQAIGARISVYAGGFGRHHQVLVANGFANQNPQVAHVGLGAATSADSVLIAWPSGRKQWVMNLAGDQVHILNEPANAVFNGDVKVISTRQVAGTSQNSEVEISTYTDIDDQNNNYVAASFSGVIDVDPGPGTTLLTSSGSDDYDEDIFLAKYNSAGDFVWAKHFPANPSGENNMYITAFSVSADGSIVVGGEFSGMVDFDPSGAQATLTTSTPQAYEGFLAKYDNNGNYVWAKQFVATGEYSSNWISDVETDALNNIIVQGEFYGQGTETIDVDLGPGQDLITSGGGEDVFIVKYTGDGTLTWKIPFATTNEEHGGRLAVDASNNIYTNFSTAASDTAVTTDLKIMKFTSEGDPLWTATSTGGESDHEGGHGIAVDDTGGLLLTGSFSGQINLQGTSGGQLLTANPNSYNGFVLRLAADGTFQWAKSFDSDGGVNFYAVSSIPNNGGIMLSGFFEGSVDMDPGEEKFEQYHPGSSAVYIRLTDTGDFVWGFSVLNSFGIHNFTTSGEMIGNLVFNGTADFDPNPTVSSLTSIGESNLAWVKYDIGVSFVVSESDSLLLKAFYDATGGPSWTVRTNWLNGDIATWHGITVENFKITAINLPDNNLTGAVPNDFGGLNELAVINLSGNKLTSIPDLSVIPSLTTVNVGKNRLDFSSLEPLKGKITNFSYEEQAVIGTPESILVNTGSPYLISLTTGGTANQYQWYRNGVLIENANASSYEIASVNRQTMGAFELKVTNTIVDGLTLSFAPKSVLAVATLSGKLYASAGNPATAGEIKLLRVMATHGYDTIDEVDVNPDGSYVFNEVILDDYQLLGFADTLTYERALPTYYKNTLYWEEADTLFLEGSIDTLDIISQLEPVEAPSGNGVIDGYVVEEVTDSGGRPHAPKRVANAGVSVRRVESSGRGKEEVLTLVSYVFTNENGEFEFTNLPVADYRLNIQYPGYPMDETSFITIPIGTNLESQKRVEAAVEEGKISVRELIITGVWQLEGYKVDVYPNPSSSFINVEFESPSRRGVQLIDVTGRTISGHETSAKNTALDVRTVRKGVYLLNIVERGQIVKCVRVEIK